MEHQGTRGNLIVGIILLMIGVMALLGQVAGPAGGFIQPVIVIGFGLAFFVAMALGGRSLGFLAIPGAIISGIGLTMLLELIFRPADFMVYSWGLIVCSVGIGLVIAGKWSGRPDMVRSGWKVAEVGLILFLVFGIIFEMVFNLGGSNIGLSGFFWPMVLVLIGLVQLVLRSYRLVRGAEYTRFRDVNLFWPVIFIGAGLLWMLVRSGGLQASQLTVLINFWPVLLIAAGINVLAGRQWQWLNLVLGVLVVVGSFYVIYNGPALGLAPRAPWAVFGISSFDNQPVTEWVSGSGEKASETRELKSFKKINLLISGDMEIVQGDSYGLTIEAEENLLPYIVTEVAGNELVIRTKPGIGIATNDGIHYRVMVKDLSAVKLSGAGTISATGLKTGDIDLTINGFGTIRLTDLTASDVQVQMNGMGTVNASGTAEAVEIKINGTGNVNMPELKAQDVSVTVSGLGNATVWAVEKLNAKFNGAGSVSYYGSPETEEDSNGLGSLKALGDK